MIIASEFSVKVKHSRLPNYCLEDNLTLPLLAMVVLL